MLYAAPSCCKNALARSSIWVLTTESLSPGPIKHWPNSALTMHARPLLIALCGVVFVAVLARGMACVVISRDGVMVRIDEGPNQRILADKPIKRDVELLARLHMPSLIKLFQGLRGLDDA